MMNDEPTKIAELPAWAQYHCKQLQDIIAMKDEQNLILRRLVAGHSASWRPSAADLRYAVARLTDVRQRLEYASHESDILAELLKSWAERAYKGETGEEERDSSVVS